MSRTKTIMVISRSSRHNLLIQFAESCPMLSHNIFESQNIQIGQFQHSQFPNLDISFLVRGCSNMMSAKIGGWQTPPPPLISKSHILPTSSPSITFVICEQFLIYYCWLKRWKVEKFLVSSLSRIQVKLSSDDDDEMKKVQNLHPLY